MDRYHIALFIHLVALIVAAGVTAVTKLAVGRRARARTVAEALDWHTVLMSTSKLFPICLAAFVVTGFYMLSLNHAAVWSTGFVLAGLIGVILLLVSGVFLAMRGKGLKLMLEEMAKHGPDQPAPKLVPPPLVTALPMINTGIALGVVFDMVTKPASVPVALSVVIVGIVISGARASRRPAPAAEGVSAT
jgi:hypothetical protein